MPIFRHDDHPLQYMRQCKRNKFRCRDGFYPNPVKDILTIKLDWSSTYKVISMTGQVMLMDEEPAVFHQVNVEQLENGLYLLLIEDSRGESKVFQFNKL